mmetsp:Transcript_8417/g.8362  ORF Transcript_8417/g.8362 Transcript_8417/m.8362 type:complete len:447 (-) Transcript_8417:247-1587(-)|eukprot:CAMPEP_0119040708 /NCGR_PEP_ID=MMETSP1177-20130426/10717_1 /TAXON_ID=2985 /ORGANISM="Ochromonas sp, Strain CCMP1899" /LENGTH=446 /DNA_ID=CAMNT_0007006019 /DNA_START=34 /DNA_END=1374 /DNA_ORIENTATION=+
MSASLRPHGDGIATVYGPYKTKKDVKKIAKGDKLDILCSDGLNYHVEVKEIAANQGRLHFRHWSVKYDYVGSFDVLYLANQGIYSEGISAQNTYPALVKRETSGEKVKSSAVMNVDAPSKNFSSGTRYPDDFLGKPRYPTTNSRKRSTEEIEEESRDDGRKKNKRIFIEGIGLVKYVPTDDGSEGTLENALEVVEVDKGETVNAATVNAGKNAEDYKKNVKELSDSKSTNKTKKPSEKKDSEKKDSKQIAQSITSNDRNSKISPSSSSSSPSSSRPLHRLIASEIDIDDETSSTIGESSIDLLKQPASSGTKGTVQTESSQKGGPTRQSKEDVADAILPVDENRSVTPSLSMSSQQKQPSAIPSYMQIQRTEQLKNLREVLYTDKSITDTGHAIEIVTNHPIVFSRSESLPSDGQPSYTAKQLLELLYARRKIDEVIQHILSTLDD